MTLLDWVPAFVTSAALGGLALPLIRAAVEKGVQSTFDLKLEKVRSELRINEEQLRAELKARDAEIDTLRRGPLSGLASRQALLEKRRLEAMEQLWECVSGMAHLRSLCHMAERVNLDILAQEAPQKTPEGQKAREFADALLTAAKVNDLAELQSAHVSRPFVPPELWTAYVAFTGVVLRTTFFLLAARGGLRREAPDGTEIIDLVKRVLPNMTSFVEELGAEKLHYLAGQLEECVVQTLMENLWGREMDQLALAATTRIVEDATLARAAPPIPASLRL